MKEELTRKDLYNLVWSKPMMTLAKEYGLSDRGLAKLCERNSIPVPPRGYWAQKTAGQRVKRAPLLDLEDKKPETAILLSKAAPVIPDQDEEQSMPESIQQAIERERRLENQIKVPATLHKPHPIVAKWIKAEEQERNWHKRYGGSRLLSPVTALDRRKKRLVSCLFKNLEVRGFQIIEEGGGRYPKEIWIRHEQDRISFQMEERIRQYRRLLTEEEKENRFSSTQKWIQERKHTGKLEIVLTPQDSSYLKVKIPEDENKNFEDTLNDVVIKIIKTFWDAKCRRIKKEEEEKLRFKAEQEHYERKMAAEKEQKRKANLEYKAFSWKHAQTIREYIIAVENAVEKGQIKTGDIDVNTWKEWALEYAKEIDFIANGNPLIHLSNDPENLFPSKEHRNGNSYRDASLDHSYWKKWYHNF